MINNTKTDKEMNEQAFYEELELRYGPALAQDIIEQIKKTEDQDNKADYMAVKALSEVLEVFRCDAQEILKQIRTAKKSGLPAEVANLTEKRLENELKNIFSCYWIAQHAFYTLYAKALKICEVPETYRYDRYSKPTEMSMAA